MSPSADAGEASPLQSSKRVAQVAADRLGKQEIQVVPMGKGVMLAPGELAKMHAYSALKQIAESE